MKLKLVAFIQWVLIVILHGAELFQDFGMLSCSQQRNITIVMYGVDIKIMERFFHHLNELVQNDACFKVNVHLPDEDRIISWQGTSDMNHIVRNYEYFGGFLSNKYSQNYAFDLIKRFGEDEFTGQQTLVFMIGWTFGVIII